MLAAGNRWGRRRLAFQSKGLQARDRKAKDRRHQQKWGKWVTGLGPRCKVHAWIPGQPVGMPALKVKAGTDLMKIGKKADPLFIYLPLRNPDIPHWRSRLEIDIGKQRCTSFVFVFIFYIVLYFQLINGINRLIDGINVFLIIFFCDY